MIYLDTHVAVWLVQGSARLLSGRARHLVATDELLISPAVVLELELLFEIGRVKDHAEVAVAALRHDLDVRVCELPFLDVARAASGLAFTRDPFDRLIVGQAAVRRSPLLTRDRRVLEHYAPALEA